MCGITHLLSSYYYNQVVHFVMNLHTLPRTFYLTRHGQSEYNLLGKIGGDSGLTPAGVEYARRLAVFAKEQIAKVGGSSSSGGGESNDGNTTTSSSGGTGGGEDTNTNTNTTKERPCRLWTSTLRRTKETAAFLEHTSFEHTFDNGETGEWLQFRQMTRRNLDELYAGVCDGMTYKEIEQVFPEEFERRQQDKLAYRYPRGKNNNKKKWNGIASHLFFYLTHHHHDTYFSPTNTSGESYMDVTLRLEPLAQEMERTREPVLIVGHQGILRILYAYFMGLDRREAPYVSIPLNNVIELTPHAYGCHEKRYCLMMKEEMLNDGQDEPVTSMPVLKRESNSFVENVNTHYAPTDPIMNAPSC